MCKAKKKNQCGYYKREVYTGCLVFVETAETGLQPLFMPSDSSELVHFKRQHNACLLESDSIKPLQASPTHPAIKTGRANQLIA